MRRDHELLAEYGTMQVFEDRSEAGRRLAEALAGRLDGPPGPTVVLAIPRGGLPIGVEVAAGLDAALDVVVVRTLRAPGNRELGFGAVGANHVDLDEELVEHLDLTQDEIDAEVAERRAVVEQRLAEYRHHVAPVDWRDTTAVVVDDGVATGGTARRACAAARAEGACRVVFAAPVGPADVDERLADACDDLVVLTRPHELLAVAQAYFAFPQLDDDDALAGILAGLTGRGLSGGARPRTSGAPAPGTR